MRNLYSLQYVCGKKLLKARRILLLASGLICINGYWMAPNVAAQESLQQAWESALQRDHTVLAARYQEQAAQAQQGASRALRLPKITMDAGYLRLQSEPSAHLSLPAIPALKNLSLPFAQDAASFGMLEMTIPLMTSGRISAGIRAADAASEARKAMTEVAVADLKLAIAHTYITVLRAQHALAVADSHVAAMRRHATDVSELNRNGYVAKHDVLATEVALANALQLQLQATNALDLARASYNRWLGRSSDAAVTLRDPEAPVMNDSASLHELSAAAMLKRPEVTALGKQAQALTAQAASVKASHLPQIGFSAGYAKLDNRYLTQDKGWYAGVMMKWDLFDGGQTKLQSSKLLAESRAVDETLKDSQEKISLQVRQAWLNRRESSLRQELADKALAQAEQVSDLARERYRNGLANNTEVLDAETRRLQAYANRDQAKYDLILSDIQLQYASGLLGQH